MKPLILIAMLSLLFAGCGGEPDGEIQTEIIRPATPPATETGEDAVVLTQTTEIPEDRSPNEGAYVNPTGAEPGTTSTAPPVPDRPR